MLTNADTCSYPSDSSVHVHAHTGYNVLKKVFTDACSHSSVHTMFTECDTW